LQNHLYRSYQRLKEMSGVLNDDTLVIALKVLRDAGEFAFKLSDYLQAKNMKQETRILLHVWPMLIFPGEGITIQGNQLEILKHGASLTLSGEIYATSPLAMAASLPQGFYNFEYAGKVDFKNFLIHQDLYKIFRE